MRLHTHIELKDRMRLLMDRHNLTRQQVADLVDVSLVTVHKWLSGGNMKADRAQEIAEKLWCDWLWLLHGEERAPEALASDLTQTMEGYGIWRLFRDTGVANRNNPLGINEAAAVAFSDELANTLGYSSGDSIHSRTFSDCSTKEGMLYTQGITAAAVSGKGYIPWNGKGLGVGESGEILAEDRLVLPTLTWTDKRGESFLLVKALIGGNQKASFD